MTEDRQKALEAFPPKSDEHFNDRYISEWAFKHQETIRKALSDDQPEFSYRDRVADWMLACFGSEITADKTERNHRFLEEALELVQSTGCTQSEAHQLVDYVYGREVGEITQEVGGVMVTLAALCSANEVKMQACGEVELARVWENIEKIRKKNAAKPNHSPLPQPPQKKENKQHFCPEWDFLEIDENSPEFEACLCYKKPPTQGDKG